MRNEMLSLINKILDIFRLRLSRKEGNRIPKDYIQTFNQQLKEARKNARGFVVKPKIYHNVGTHPISFRDIECAFVSRHLSRIKPEEILDIGSYRWWIIGLLANSKVTSIDVREREKITPNETVVTCDAKELTFSDDVFDVITSICAIEHFGLGRYGDNFDLDADIKAFNEMIRVVKPGGSIIFTTTITDSEPSIVFNGHRIYNHSMIKDLCSNLECEEELFFNLRTFSFCSYENLNSIPYEWDLYLGCWKKRN